VDSAAGFVDGFLNTINPFDEFWSVPDIGPVFGHEDAYGYGQIAGNVAGMVTNIAISMIPGAGLVSCGAKVAKGLLTTWEVVNAVGDVATAAKHAYEGNFGWGDALGLVGAAFSIKATKSFNCFTVDMNLTEGMIDRQLVIPPAPLARTDRDANVNDALVVVFVGMLFTTSLQFRRSRRRRFLEMSHAPLIPDTFIPRADRPVSSDDDAALDAVFGSDSDWSRDLHDAIMPTRSDHASLDQAFAESDIAGVPRLCEPCFPANVSRTLEAPLVMLAKPPRRDTHHSELRRWLFLFVGLVCSGLCLLQSGRVSLPSATATTAATGSPDSPVSGSRSDKRSADVSGPTASGQPQYKMKSVAAFKEGDDILAYDHATGQPRMSKVTRTFKNIVYHLRLLEIEDASGNRQVIKTTNEHPFYDPYNEYYKPAKWLKSGDDVQTLAGEAIHIISSTYEPHPEGVPVYNVEVEGDHNYFVSAYGARGPPVLAHNRCTELHHPIPKFLGGDDKQDLYKLGKKQHREFHKMLDTELKAKGFKISGLNGATEAWTKHFAKNAGSQKQAFDAVVKATKKFDLKFGKELTKQVRENMRNGQFKNIP
ncbi:MAG: polymorphic toxin-type HINT domain-containing protein, partial [Planctomycetaceae bacterium]